MSTVNLIKLLKRFDGVAVIDLDIPIDLRSGELIHIAGPAGAGKTILAQLIAGLIPLDDGEIFIDGHLMNTVLPGMRKIGLMLGEDGLWPHLSVAENVGIGLKGSGLTRREQRAKIEAALAAAKIESQGDQRIDKLTQALKRRVALARALAISPALLVLDDPFASLDARAREELRDDIRQVVAEEQVTTIILTSNSREAMALSERVAILDLGRIIQVGSPMDLYNHPSNAFVARFLGDVNLIQGQVEGPGGRGELIIRTPIGRLIATATTGPLAVGTPVTLAIRPEALSISPHVPSGANRFPATVERQVFLGEVRQIFLRAPADWPLTALALQSQSGGLREGQSLAVSLMPDQIALLASKIPTGERIIA